MDSNLKNTKITSKEDITKWYTELIFYAKLAKYGPVKGTIYICPNAFFIWERIQFHANNIFQSFGINNVYFPIFIPMSYIEKEKSHVKGFKPELAIINSIGDKALPDKIALRPTSETIFCNYFKEEIQSYKELPIILNQWCNVIRWEKNTRPFLRNSEFLWQEGHGAFASDTEAKKFTNNIIIAMQKFFREKLCMETILGKKTESEKFAGADETLTLEIVMPNGYCLQLMTSHYLNNNFSKAFEINFLDKDNKKKNIIQNSFGFSTRILAALVMTHGDDFGMVLPSSVVKHQIHILLMSVKNDSANKDILEYGKKIQAILETKYSVYIDISDKNLGYKCIQSELQGIPVYIEVGLKDIEKNSFNVYRRDIREKKNITFKQLDKYVDEVLKTYDKNLLNKSLSLIKDKIVICYTKDEILKAIDNYKVALAPFSLDTAIEDKFKEQYAISSRCIELNKPITDEKCAFDKKLAAKGWVYFGKAY